VPAPCSCCWWQSCEQPGASLTGAATLPEVPELKALLRHEEAVQGITWIILHDVDALRIVAVCHRQGALDQLLDEVCSVHSGSLMMRYSYSLNCASCCTCSTPGCSPTNLQIPTPKLSMRMLSLLSCYYVGMRSVCPPYGL
jgi:hypothetical protein